MPGSGPRAGDKRNVLENPTLRARTPDGNVWGVSSRAGPHSIGYCVENQEQSSW